MAKYQNKKRQSLGQIKALFFFVFVKKEPHILFVYIPEIAHGITAE